MMDKTYVFEQAKALIIGNGYIEAEIGIPESPCLAAVTNKLTSTSFRFAVAPICALRFASGNLRIDIPEWRFHPGSGEAVLPQEDLGYREGYYLPGVNEEAWTAVQQLNNYPIGGSGYSATVYPGYGWYRCPFTLPPEARGQPIVFGLGGQDNQDWLEYWIYVNGTPIGYSTQPAGGHDSPVYLLQPGAEGYDALRFGAPSLLAVQARGLDRRPRNLPASDCERYSLGTNVVDQYVSVGSPYREVDTFHLLARESLSDTSQAMVTLKLATLDEDTELTVRYWVTGDEGVLHKQLTVHNRAADEQTLLEMDLQQLTVDVPLSGGGLGFPCTIGDELFCGILHPAGHVHVIGHTAHLRLLPGRRLKPDEAYESKIAILGTGPVGQAGQSCVRYLERHGRRRRELLFLYDIYGLHDIAGMENPTPVTESLVSENLDLLAQLQRHGIAFDYYYLDAGWSNPWGDMTDFDPRNFPAGPTKVVQRTEQLGMRLGLWLSPASGPMAFHPRITNPVLAPCGTLPSSGITEAGKHRGNLCVASEPWRSGLRSAIIHHMRHNHVRGFKLDGADFLCTNPEHDHLPGKYSTEAIMDAVIEALEAAHQECPDVMIMYYWGFRSPWWLLYGDTLYERGVLMEGATPSDHPSRLLRQSVNLSFDQATHYAWDMLPLPSQDSLGVWLSETRWGNYMGSEGWRDAWIMEIPRGSMLAQLWGDLSLLSAEDIDFLAASSAWLRTNRDLLLHPKRILGDPWQAEPYGYTLMDGDRGAVFLYNPRFTQERVTIGLDETIGFHGIVGSDRYVLKVIHGGQHPRHPLEQRNLTYGETFDILMDPFEILMLQVYPISGSQVAAFPVHWCGTERSRSIACQLSCISQDRLTWDDPASLWPIRRVVNGRAQYVDTEEGFRLAEIQSDERDRHVTRRHLTGRLLVPPLRTATNLILVARLLREGIHWHHHALYDIVRLSASLSGQDVAIRTLPSRWHEQAGGWSWIQYQARLPENRMPAEVSLDIQAILPATVETEFEAWLLPD